MSALGSPTDSPPKAYPSNPTGAVMAESEFAVVADVCRAQGIWLVLDLCYEQLIYDALSPNAVPHNLPGIAARMRIPVRRPSVASIR